MISVVIPMYNSERTIVRAIESVLNQTKNDLVREIIVVNDGSNDKSKQVTISFFQEAQLKYKCIDFILINQENAGVSTARNNGVKKATSDWIAFLDSDDAWKNNKLEEDFKIISTYKNIKMVSSNMKGDGWRWFLKKNHKPFKITPQKMFYKSMAQPSTVVLDQKSFWKAGGFDTKQSHAEDGNLFMKIAFSDLSMHNPVCLIEYGDGKRGFGQEGLSGNLPAMYRGNLKNITEAYDLNMITFAQKKIFMLWAWIKYMRRIIITARMNKYDK